MNRNSLKYHLVESPSHHMTIFWRCLGTAFGHFLLDSHKSWSRLLARVCEVALISSFCLPNLRPGSFVTPRFAHYVGCRSAHTNHFGNCYTMSEETATLLCLISVGFHSGLCVAITFFTNIIIFYQLSDIIFFGVHSNYLCYVSQNDTLSQML